MHWFSKWVEVAVAEEVLAGTADVEITLNTSTDEAPAGAAFVDAEVVGPPLASATGTGAGARASIRGEANARAAARASSGDGGDAGHYRDNIEGGTISMNHGPLGVPTLVMKNRVAEEESTGERAAK